MDIVTLALDPTIGSAVVGSFSDLVAQAWLVIPAGLGIFGLIYGLGKVKQAGKKAAA